MSLLSQTSSLEKPVKLRNLLNGDSTLDNLHRNYKKQNIKTHGCSESRCLASLINPKPIEYKVRSLAETLEQAKDFINNYYASIKRLDSPAHKTRLAEIEEQLRTTETYYLKETELIYGAKQAWRNAPRCIGRIQWSKLQVFDARFTSTATEMFEALCNHIKYSTNKGSLRSAITILPQRKKSTKNDWRVWNSQLIGYAGYRNPETNEIIGDPANADFTEVCQKLGWQGKGTRFDILPLVLQAQGGPPEVFPLPEDLVLRVKLKHPKYNWFEELGLEWYAVPAVANMMLDVGGLQFTAAPFSGWYMVTEIGTRDLCDSNRYNILETVALKMGLNTTSNMSLWKDQALLEVNMAVLDSFQTAGVTIVDHHTACDTFMTHLSNEQRLRGGCPADWVWLVPPTAGSTTQVFHQEMVNYHLLPNYEYMEPVWKNFDWVAWEKQRLESEDSGKLGMNSDSRVSLASKVSSALPMSPATPGLNGELTPRKLRFKEIARAVKFTSKLFGKALSRRIKATILYATETGKSERFANKLAQVFSRAFNVHLMSMNDYDMTCLEHEALLLVVTSTFGNGDPPETGELFAKHLAAVKQTGDTSPDIDSINSVSTNPFFQMLSEDHKDSVMNSMENDNSDSSPLDRRQKSNQDKQEQQTNIRPLSNVRFGVFALGSTAYPHFCAFGRYVDQTLGDLGAERILKCACGDELSGQEKAFNEWSSEVFKIACDVFCLTDTIGPIDERPEILWTPEDVKFVAVELIDDDIEGTNYVKQSQMAIRNQQTPDRSSPVTIGVTDSPKGISSEIVTSKKTILRNLMNITNKRMIPFTVSNRIDLHKFIPEENLQTLCIDLESDLISNNNEVKFGTPRQSNSLTNGVTSKHSSSMTTFEAGDHVAIYPTNKTEMVDRLLDRMRQNLNESETSNDDKCTTKKLEFDQVYTILVKRENMDLTPATGMSPRDPLSKENWIVHDRLPITTIREALTRYLDITNPPNQEFLLILSRLAKDSDEKKRLHQMGKNFTIYEAWKNKTVPTLLSLLEEFKSVKFEPALLTQIPQMKPRFYSISGSGVSLTLGVVRFKTASGELREGLCSNYLNTVPIEPDYYVYGYIRSAPGFHMPTNKRVPMILISAGTGIAPFRSFWQQRYADMFKKSTRPLVARTLFLTEEEILSTFGTIDLYFGCRNSHYILYQEELDEMHATGVLSSISIAFSRPLDRDVIGYVDDKDTNGVSGKSKISQIRQARKRTYVQEKLLEDSKRVFRLIMQEGAHVYVCGDVAMASGVYKTLATICSNRSLASQLNDQSDTTINNGVSTVTSKSDDGETIMMNLRNLNRYHEDIFGAKGQIP